jgi:16S rRNA (cytidine1402-2'-O)-methyltransferase
LKYTAAFDDVDFQLLNKDTRETDIASLMKPLMDGKDMGVLSEAGCPGIADPGALAVRYAHLHNLAVMPLVGPSSIVLALMASGLNGQSFSFHGYLPIEQRDAAARIKELEKESRNKKQTQIFIEAPHRNNSIFNLLVRSLSPGTHLTIALDLTGAKEVVRTKTAGEWASEKPSWPKLPAIFLFLA